MPVHLNITLDAELVRRLRKRTPPKKISAFIADAVAARLGPSAAELERAYADAAREPWRKRLADEWSATEVEAWPD